LTIDFTSIVSIVGGSGFMSALLQTTDLREMSGHVRYVPLAAVLRATDTAQLSSQQQFLQPRGLAAARHNVTTGLSLAPNEDFH